VSATFLTAAERTTVEALVARIFPGDAEDPGAREADVVGYVDRSLAGEDAGLQRLYRDGLSRLEELCGARFGVGFIALPEPAQDELLREIERTIPAPAATHGDPAPLADERAGALGHLFAMVREHTLEGMFADPQYGGNRGMAGWRLIGFPGAQWSYSAQQRRVGFDARGISPLGLEDLRRIRAGGERA
jgi:gluconate 2-dehydrogenase gamma chain